MVHIIWWVKLTITTLGALKIRVNASENVYTHVSFNVSGLYQHKLYD